MHHIIAETTDGIYELHLNAYEFNSKLFYHTLFLIDTTGHSRVQSHGSTPNTTEDDMITYFTELVNKPKELQHTA